jgi:hypothetical protein
MGWLKETVSCRTWGLGQENTRQRPGRIEDGKWGMENGGLRIEDGAGIE